MDELVNRFETTHRALRSSERSYRALVALIPTVTMPSLVAPTLSVTPLPTAVPPSVTPSPTPAFASSGQLIGSTPRPTREPTVSVAVFNPIPLAARIAEPVGTIIYTCFDGVIDQICTIEADGDAQRQHTMSDAANWYASITNDSDIYF